MSHCFNSHQRITHAYQGKIPPKKLQLLLATQHSWSNENRWYIDNGASSQSSCNEANLSLGSTSQGNEQVAVGDGGNGAGLPISHIVIPTPVLLANLADLANLSLNNTYQGNDQVGIGKAAMVQSSPFLTFVPLILPSIYMKFQCPDASTNLLSVHKTRHYNRCHFIFSPNGFCLRESTKRAFPRTEWKWHIPSFSSLMH